MITAKKVKGTAVPMPTGIAVGTITSLMITVVLAALLTWLALHGKISEDSLGYYIMGILALASFLGPVLSAGKIKRRRMLVCGITGAAYYAVLLLCTALMFGGQYKGLGVTALLVFGGSVVAGVLGLKKPGKQRSGYAKYRNR